MDYIEFYHDSITTASLAVVGAGRGTMRARALDSAVGESGPSPGCQRARGGLGHVDRLADRGQVHHRSQRSQRGPRDLATVGALLPLRAKAVQFGAAALGPVEDIRLDAAGGADG